MNYTLIRSDRKTVTLKLTPEGEVVVRAPRRCSTGYINSFVEAHGDWIERHRAILLKRKACRDSFRFRDGDEISLCGTVFRIRILPCIRAALVQDLLVLPSEDVGRVRKDLLPLVKEYSLPRLRDRLDYWAARMGVSYREVKLSTARSRWGSCTRDGVIRISVFLLFAPMDAIDYVLVHELSHRTCFDHSAAFWARVESMIPNWKEERARLRTYQTEPFLQSLAMKEG